MIANAVPEMSLDKKSNDFFLCTKKKYFLAKKSRFESPINSR